MRRVLLQLLPLLLGTAAAVNFGYDVSLEQYKESSELTNSISLAQELTSRVSMSANASFTAQRNRDLNRFIDGRVGSARVGFRPISKIELGVNLSRSISTEERYGELVRDQLSNTTSGEVRYTPFSWLSMSMNLGAHYLDYVSPSGDTTISGYDEGGVRNANISMSRSLSDRLGTNVTLITQRTLGNQTDNGTDQLGARVSYSFPSLFRGGNLSAEVNASSRFTEYKDSTQTLSQDTRSTDLNLVVPLPWDFLSMEVSTGWDYTDRSWEDEADTTGTGDVRDRLERRRSISSSIRYRIIDDLELDLTVSRSIDRNDRKRSATGVDRLFDVHDTSDDRSFTASLQYSPGDARITFERLVQLYRYDTFGSWTDKWGNVYRDNSDRDEYIEVLALFAEIPVTPRVTLESSMQGQRRETIYLMSEQSGNSKVSSTYSITPGFRYEAGNDWTLRESVKITADYTTFIFPGHTTSGTDLLFRRMLSNISFQRVSPQDSTTLGISHSLQFQDQGRYEDSVFLRSEEVLSSTLTFNLGFRAGTVGVTPSYSWEYSRRDYLASSVPPLVEHLHHVGLRTRLGLGDGVLSMQLKRTFYSREDRESYWRANVGLNYQF